MKKTPNEIAWEVKRTLSNSGISMAEAARRLGCSAQAVSNQLNGDRPMGRKVAERWASEFGFNIPFLMSGEGVLQGEEQVEETRKPIIIPAETQDLYNNMARAIADLAEIVRRSGIGLPPSVQKNFHLNNPGQ